MGAFTVPTSRDISIEVNGRRLAVVESYKSSAVKESRAVEAFGSIEPVASVGGKVKYTLELSRVYINPTAKDDVTDFYSLEDFNVVIVKPDCKIIYSGCQWAAINESAGLNDTVLEQCRIVAARRLVTV